MSTIGQYVIEQQQEAVDNGYPIPQICDPEYDEWADQIDNDDLMYQIENDSEFNDKPPF